jgi:hypothetical protein
LLNEAKTGTVNSWNDIHNFYLHSGKQYPEQKRQHAFASLLELLQLQKQEFTVELFTTLMQDTLTFKQWMFDNIQSSRAKDYENEFRKMVYTNEAEMEAVVGRLEDNVFINQQKAELETFATHIQQISQQFSFAMA